TTTRTHGTPDDDTSGSAGMPNASLAGASGASSSGSAGMPIASAGGGSSPLVGTTAAEAGRGGATFGGGAGGSAASGASAGSGVTNGGSTGGTAALGGAAGNQGQGCDGTIPFPSTSTTVLDDFSRGALDASWTSNTLDATAHYQLASGQLSTTAGLEDAIFWDSAFGANEEVSATLVSYDENLYSACLLLKSERHDLQGFVIAVSYAASFNGSQYLDISVENGGWTRAASRTDVEVGFGDNFGARAFSNGCVEVFVNGKFVLGSDLSQIGLATTAYKKSSGYVGIANVLGGQVLAVRPTVWDNFAAGTLP
ncbi:MAG TPA: hypothetical protein VIV60_19960, partial [Polyangiaceae bacterium]